MSDVLARLAARAVGQPPTARPRLPARFEPPGASDAGLVGLIVEDLVAPADTVPGDEAAAPGAPANATARAAEGRPRPSRPQAGAAPSPRPSPDAAAAVREPAGGRPAAPPGTARPARRHAGASTPDGPRRSEAVASATPGRADDPGGPSTTAARPAVRAPAPILPPRPHPSGAAAATTSPTAGPGVSPTPGPVVRIHIGRLEVRANLDAPPPPRRAEANTSRDAGVEELSLGAYLRGERQGR